MRHGRVARLATGGLVACAVTAGCTGGGEEASPTTGNHASSDEVTTAAPESPGAPGGGDPSTPPRGSSSSGSTPGSSGQVSGEPAATQTSPGESTVGDEPTGEDEPTAGDEPASEYGHTVAQQLAASPRDRARVQERVEALQGRYAAESWSVYTTVNADGTGVSEGRVWGLGPEGTVTCSGSGAVAWMSQGVGDTTSEQLGCEPAPLGGDASAAPPPEDRLQLDFAADVPDGGSGGVFMEDLPGSFTVVATPETSAWVGVHTALTEREASSTLRADREAALEDLGDASPRGGERALVESSGSDVGRMVRVGIFGEAGTTHVLTASCRGEGAFELSVDSGGAVDDPLSVRCGTGDSVREEITFHGQYSSHTVVVWEDPRTRGVLTFDLSPAAS
ncbi:hypothetical protein BJF82_05060 [Kytococcus sp. CUA-901]|nr:hypothetical protein BJF82_05060 [Kytococcus sp. CUA-901]